LKQLFNIPGDEAQHSDLLICELSHYHICLAQADAATGQIQSLQYYENSTPLTKSDIAELLQVDEINQKRFKTLLVGSAFPDATLVPLQLATENNLHTFLNVSADSPVFSDAIEAQGMQVVYAIPQQFYEVLNAAGQVSTVHVHTAAIRTQQTDAASYMALHFTSKEFRVLAVKEGQVQLAQIYPFTAPLDVVYYLLMISAQYNLSQHETIIYLSGLVDEASALYKELYQYYTQVLFAPPGAFTLPPNDHQPHFFSSVYNLAACASSVVS